MAHDFLDLIDELRDLLDRIEERGEESGHEARTLVDVLRLLRHAAKDCIDDEEFLEFDYREVEREA